MVVAMALQAPSVLGGVVARASLSVASSSPCARYNGSAHRPRRQCGDGGGAAAGPRKEVPFGEQFCIGARRLVACRLVSSQQTCSSIRASSSQPDSKEDEAATATAKTTTIAFSRALQNCAVCMAVAAALILPVSPAPATLAFERGPAMSELSVLISGPPIKDANALLRYALPISNKQIKEVQKSLEEIVDEMKVPGEKALGAVERSVRQAARVLNQNKAQIVADIADGKKEQGQQLVDKLNEGLQEYQKLLEQKDRSIVFPKQKELLRVVGSLEEAMVGKFPYEVPEEFVNRPLLKGRATVEMRVTVKNNPNVKDAVLQIVLDGYNAPVTAGNFIDLVARKFYDGMEIQRADGFVVQTGDPEGPTDGFVDPGTGQVRTIPLEIMVDGEKQPIYGSTLEELGMYKSTTTLPFNAFGTMAMAREEFDNDSASSQVFWLLKESELTPSSANILDGRYTVFGYVTENQDLLADLKVGDVIESVRVTNGLDNLVNPSYKVGAA